MHLRSKTKKILAIPNKGLGDVLYTLLFLQLLKTKGYRNCSIIAPSTARELVQKFNINYHLVHSSLLRYGNKLDVMGEYMLYGILKSYTNTSLLTIFNDVLDYTMTKVFSFEPLDANLLGNYYKIFPVGKRRKLNSFFKFHYHSKKENPKHLLARQLLILNRFDISLNNS